MVTREQRGKFQVHLHFWVYVRDKAGEKSINPYYLLKTGKQIALERKNRYGNTALERNIEPYGQAVDELVVKFNHIKQEYQNARMYSPIESVSGRVKSISSIMEKTQRKNVRIEELEDKIEDIAGIRIICQFVEDINTVVKL